MHENESGDTAKFHWLTIEVPKEYTERVIDLGERVIEAIRQGRKPDDD